MADPGKKTTQSNQPQLFPRVQIAGEFPENLSKSQEYLLLMFSPSSLPLKKRWRTNGLSADFLADYLVTFFPRDEGIPEAIVKQAEIQSAVSYIANELLENAMKFSNPASSQPISINLQLYPDKLVFLVTNSIDPAGMQKYQLFIQEAISSEPGDMLLRRLEQNVDAQEPQSSGLGLVIIMNDYLARLGWKFESSPGHPEAMTVTTVVQLSI